MVKDIGTKNEFYQSIPGSFPENRRPNISHLPKNSIIKVGGK
jgi:hypothetical protein